MNQTLFYDLDELINLKNLRSSSVSVNNHNNISNSNQYRDVHSYDGKLVSPPEINIRLFDYSEKEILFNKLNSILINPRASWMVSKMLQEHELIDYANKIKPSDLLATILTRRFSIDVFLLLEEQLADIALLGQCPQGRSTRLIQFLELTK